MYGKSNFVISGMAGCRVEGEGEMNRPEDRDVGKAGMDEIFPPDQSDGGRGGERDHSSGGWSSRARKYVRGGRHSRRGGRYSAQKIFRGRGRRAPGQTLLMSGWDSPPQEIRLREGFGSLALENPGGWEDSRSPERGIREWGGSATPEDSGASESLALADPRGWGGLGSPARENSGLGSALKSLEGWESSVSPAREKSGGRDWGSPEGEDGEELEGSRSEYPKTENDDMQEHVSPEHEGGKSAGRNCRERIQSLQSSLKSVFDDMQADLVRAERENKGLTEANKRLKGELKRAKEGEVFCKQRLQQTRYKLSKLLEQTKILEEKRVELLKKTKEQEESNKKLEEKQVELLKKTKEQEESNKKLEEELKRAVKGEECSKQDLEQTKNKLRELCTTFAAVKEECDKVCDQQGGVPQVVKNRKYVLKVLEVNDLLNCSICLEPWAQSGEHTVCSLICGHFFGKSCITKWILKDESRGSSTCPACSRRVTLSDIRHHYVSQIYET